MQKKSYITLVNIVGCANLRICQLTRMKHTIHFIPLVHNVLFNGSSYTSYELSRNISLHFVFDIFYKIQHDFSYEVSYEILVSRIIHIHAV